MTFIEQIRDAARKRAAYRRTVTELSALPLDSALDLEIDRSDVHRIAANAVYGR